MLFFDLLFGDDSKKIYSKDFNKALGQIPDISKEERAYLNDVFQKDLADGLSKYELEERIAKLRYKSDDPLDPWEVEQVKKKLSGELE